MKVLHILQSNRFSGAENVVCQIIDMMRADPDVQMVYCSRDGQIREALAERNIEFAPIESVSVAEIKRVIKEHSPDVIHAHDRSASMYAALATKKIPIVVHMHVNNNKGFACFLKNLAWFAVSSRYKKIFWVSQSSFDGFTFHTLLKKKSQVLYNVIDKDALDQKAALDTTDYAYDVVYVGRLTFQKDPERLMKVLRDVCRKKDGLKIAIVGEGDYAEFVKNYIAENHLQDCIDYLGYRTNPLKIVTNAKALVLTSRFEGTPMVAIEAQIMGTPIVSTPVDGMKQIVCDGENGFLTGDDDTMVERLIALATDSALYDAMSRKSRKRSERYSNTKEFKDIILKSYYLTLKG